MKHLLVGLHRVFCISMRCDIGLITVRKSLDWAAIKAHLGDERGTILSERATARTAKEVDDVALGKYDRRIEQREGMKM